MKWQDKIADWLWPHLTGESSPSPQDKEFVDAKSSGLLLEEIEPVMIQRTAQVEERLRTVESKLLSLLTLTAVLSAAVTASLVAVSAIGKLKDIDLAFVLIAAVLVLYIALQLLRSLWATTNGLVRRGYKQMAILDIVPSDGETKDQYRLRILNARANHMRWNEWVVDQKVSEMAVAHQALRNALAGTGGLIVVAFLIAIMRLVA